MDKGGRRVGGGVRRGVVRVRKYNIGRWKQEEKRADYPGTLEPLNFSILLSKPVDRVIDINNHERKLSVEGNGDVERRKHH